MEGGHYHDYDDNHASSEVMRIGKLMRNVPRILAEGEALVSARHAEPDDVSHCYGCEQQFLSHDFGIDQA